MKLCTLALDFDGLIAIDDQLDSQVREAIATLRGRRTVALIVTSRILEALERVSGSLHFMDAVVAESGALIAFPSSGY